MRSIDAMNVPNIPKSEAVAPAENVGGSAPPLTERCGQCIHHGVGRQGGHCAYEAYADWCRSGDTCHFKPSRFKSRFKE